MSATQNCAAYALLALVDELRREYPHKSTDQLIALAIARIDHTCIFPKHFNGQAIAEQINNHY